MAITGQQLAEQWFERRIQGLGRSQPNVFDKRKYGSKVYNSALRYWQEYYKNPEVAKRLDKATEKRTVTREREINVQKARSGQAQINATRFQEEKYKAAKQSSQQEFGMSVREPKTILDFVRDEQQSRKQNAKQSFIETRTVDGFTVTQRRGGEESVKPLISYPQYGIGNTKLQTRLGRGLPSQVRDPVQKGIEEYNKIVKRENVRFSNVTRLPGLLYQKVTGRNVRSDLQNLYFNQEKLSTRYFTPPSKQQIGFTLGAIETFEDKPFNLLLIGGAGVASGSAFGYLGSLGTAGRISTKVAGTTLGGLYLVNLNTQASGFGKNSFERGRFLGGETVKLGAFTLGAKLGTKLVQPKLSETDFRNIKNALRNKEGFFGDVKVNENYAKAKIVGVRQSQNIYVRSTRKFNIVGQNVGKGKLTTEIFRGNRLISTQTRLFESDVFTSRFSPKAVSLNNIYVDSKGFKTQTFNLRKPSTNPFYKTKTVVDAIGFGTSLNQNYVGVKTYQTTGSKIGVSGVKDYAGSYITSANLGVTGKLSGSGFLKVSYVKPRPLTINLFPAGKSAKFSLGLSAPTISPKPSSISSVIYNPSSIGTALSATQGATFTPYKSSGFFLPPLTTRTPKTSFNFKPVQLSSGKVSGRTRLDELQKINLASSSGVSDSGSTRSKTIQVQIPEINQDYIKPFPQENKIISYRPVKTPPSFFYRGTLEEPNPGRFNIKGRVLSPQNTGRYTVEVKRFGSFRPVATTRKLSQAINIGAGITSRTLAQTFRVKGVGRYKTPAGFKRRGNVFTEFPSLRLDTYTERKELKQSPRKKRRKKR